MSDERIHPEAEQPEADDAFDALLARAIWPEPTAESTARLQEQWRQLSSDERDTTQLLPLGDRFIIRSHWGTFSYAAAAAILLAIGMWYAIHLGSKPLPQIAQEPWNHATGHATAPNRDVTVVQPIVEIAPHVASRPPTEWELAIIHREFPRKPRPIQPPDTTPDPVDAALAKVLQNAPVTVIAQEISASANGTTFERSLAQRIRTERGPKKTAAVRLLAEVATAQSVPLLVTLSHDPTLAEPALAALMRVADANTLAALARSTTNRDEQQRILSALLHREPARAVSLYLPFVADAATAQIALQALDGVESPPVDALFSRLNDPRIETRLAAARALGRIDGPSTTVRLAALVERNQNRREALLALASSSGPEAKQYLKVASASGSLAGAVRSAQLQRF